MLPEGRDEVVRGRLRRAPDVARGLEERVLDVVARPRADHHAAVPIQGFAESGADRRELVIRKMVDDLLEEHAI